MTPLRVVLVVVLLLALPAGAAQAKSPPKGKYPCYYSTFSGTFPAGILYITSKSKYNVNKKGKGKYKTKGRKISFKSGAYAKSKVYGVWTQGGRPERHELRDPDLRQRPTRKSASSARRGRSNSAARVQQQLAGRAAPGDVLVGPPHLAHRVDLAHLR